MEITKPNKPMGGKNYGSIGHLPSSRTGPSDWHVHEGQARIACERARDKHDRIIVTEKYDGSNVGVGRVGDEIVALGRAGYPAETSKYEQHQHFARWVRLNQERFLPLLGSGERVIGEWLLQAHGTRYAIESPLSLFVAFDIMTGAKRAAWDDVVKRCAAAGLHVARVVSDGPPMSVEHALDAVSMAGGSHGAIDSVEGAVWRVERKGVFDFMAKYVRLDKVDGCLLPELIGGGPVWNYPPDHLVPS